MFQSGGGRERVGSGAGLAAARPAQPKSGSFGRATTVAPGATWSYGVQVLKNALFIFARSAKFTTPSPVRSALHGSEAAVAHMVASPDDCSGG